MVRFLPDFRPRAGNGGIALRLGCCRCIRTAYLTRIDVIDGSFSPQKLPQKAALIDNRSSALETRRKFGTG